MKPQSAETPDRSTRRAPRITAVVPCFNESEILPTTHHRLTRALEDLPTEYEILYVDDGSTDGTDQVLRALAAGDPRVVVVTLSRNFGHQVALSAGLDHAAGDAVVLIDADLQDPPELIAHMVGRWREGYDVVYGVRRNRAGEPSLRMAATRAFYWCVRRISEVPLPVNAADFRLIDRRLVNILREMPEPDRYLRGMVAWLGFRQCALEYDREPRHAGRSKYTPSKLARLAVDGIVSSTVNPVAWSYLVACLLSVTFLSTLVWAVFSGPTDTRLLAALITLLAAGQYFALGLIGESLGRLLRTARRRPLYLVDEVIGSDASPPGSSRVDRRLADNYVEVSTENGGA